MRQEERFDFRVRSSWTLFKDFCVAAAAVASADEDDDEERAQ